jgi:hypothetical protein
MSSDNEDSQFDTENSSSQASTYLATNQLLQIGQNLIKAKQKRPLEESNRTGPTNPNQAATGGPNQSDPTLNAIEVYHEKFSFLKKDKTYLSRLSNYVCKTLNSHDNKANSVNVKSDMQKSRNMVFSCLSQAPPASDASKKQLNEVCCF